MLLSPREDTARKTGKGKGKGGKCPLFPSWQSVDYGIDSKLPSVHRMMGNAFMYSIVPNGVSGPDDG